MGIYAEPNKTLATLVAALINLNSLDISGTNLAGTGVFEGGKSETESRNLARCDIPGLVSRVENNLDFLGLYKACHEASCRVMIPAKKVWLILSLTLNKKFPNLASGTNSTFSERSMSQPQF